MEPHNCLHCQQTFTPNKYSPKQEVCSDPECQKKRQLQSMKLWRERNPNYFKYDESKGITWLEAQRRRSKQWREKNPEKVKSYRSNHAEDYRQYMCQYMREYRKKRKETGSAFANPNLPTDLPQPEPPQTPMPTPPSFPESKPPATPPESTA